MSRTLQGSQEVQQLATLSHLEQQMSAARALNSHAEYKLWLLNYAQYIVQESKCDNVMIIYIC